MKKIRVCFDDFWHNFDSRNNFFVRFLSEHFEIEISNNNPDYCFFSIYGFEHLKYSNCVKIAFIGENIVPDFNFCDYALGFQYLEFGDRYKRFPLYFTYGGYDELNHDHEINESKLLNRKFCNYIYSNNTTANPIRSEFFEKLSKYKKIDAGGKQFNNIGGQVKDKINFVKDYKFTIAFESSAFEGYTTEKIFEPMLVNSLPIYYGNPKVDLEFNSESFLWLKNPKEMDEILDKIIELDKDNSAYISMIKKPFLNEKQRKYNWKYDLLGFFDNIFSQTHSEAIRRPTFGYSDYYLKEFKQMSNLMVKHKNLNRIKSIAADFSHFFKSNQSQN